MAIPKTRNLIFAVIGSGCLFIFLAILNATAKKQTEPSFQGRPLTAWLSETRITETGGIALSAQAAEAVRAMGTNAIPSLLAKLRSSDSQLKLRMLMLYQKQPLLRFHIPTNGERQYAAMRGFRALGLAAKPAFPDIVSLVLAADDSGQAINSLTEADAETIALLANGLKNPDRKIRLRAVVALAALRQAPTVSLPALTETLKDSDPEVRAQAALALSVYGDASFAAQFTALQHDPNPDVCRAASEALRNLALINRAQQKQ